MVVLIIALLFWWLTGWKAALCVLAPALAAEFVWWRKQARNG